MFMKQESLLANKVYQGDGNGALLEMVPAHFVGRALDCGCGVGGNAGLLTAHGWCVDGITISAKEQEIAAERCHKVYLADFEQGLPELDGPYDLVLMSHVLEHLVHPEFLLSNIKAVMARDARVAVALPNALFCTQRLRFLLGNFQYTETGIMDETHLHFYTYRTGEALLTRQGYTVLKKRVQGAFPFSRLRTILPKPLTTLVDRWVSRRFPNLFGFQSLYYAEIAR
jgi:2-polyprenyl-3-methyl-5-hydroxy-6-metoxy-1,4-benzoquinol methylase